ncbi:hypothetical protein Tco_1356895, partial [Tanacetum coccineum]
YVPGPEEPEQVPLSPDYVPGPEHADDEIVAEDQPGRGGGSSEDDEDDDMDIEADDEEEEDERLAPTDSVVVALLATDQAPSMEETEPFETDESTATPPPHPAYRVTARISIPAPVPTPLWSDAEIPSPSLPLSPPSPVLSPAPPPSPIRSLGYRATMIRMRDEVASTSHSPPLSPPFILSPTRPDAPLLGIPPPLPISVPTSSPPLLLPSASRREDRPEVTLPPWKRLGIALGPGYKVGESSSTATARPDGGLRADYGFVATMDREIRRDPEREVGYGITESWNKIVETLQGAPVSTDTELGRHMIAFETRVRQDTNEVYTRLHDEQSQRQEAWRRSMDASDLARGEIMSLCTTVLAQMSEIRELHDADHRRQAQQLIQTLTVMQSLQREVTSLLGQVTTLQGQVTALQGQVIALQGQVTILQGQQGPVGGSAQPELPEEAGSSS